MSSDSQSIDEPTGTSNSQDNMPCPNCRAQMPKGMRFCRLCGFRLGEGVEEYTETVRFGPQTVAAAQQPHGAQPWGTMSPAGAPQTALGKKKRKGKGPHWIVWVILGVIVASVAGGSFLRPFNVNIGGKSGAASSAPASKFGVNSFVSVDGGAMLDAITPPDGPADKAGLLGGDVIKSFDGQAVAGESEIKKILASTPIGKTVEVVYVRDGETKTTKMTTTSAEELDRLTEAFEDREGGKGFIAEGTHLERIQVPGMNIYGVQLHDVRKNRPGYISGLRNEDIVIEFDGLPMRTRREFELRIERAKPDSTVKTIVIRNGERVELDIKIGVDD